MDPISVEKKIGERECRVAFSRGSLQCELNIHYQDKGETWIASKKGSPAEIAAFIELAPVNLPDTKLINSALEELSSKIPDGMLSVPWEILSRRPIGLSGFGERH
jgi:hypothetical protein